MTKNPEAKKPEEWLEKVSPAEKDQGQLQTLSRLCPRRGQNLQHAERGHPPRTAAAKMWSLASSKRTAAKASQELAEQLEAVPRRKLEYSGTIFEEMDVDAILARHPQVVLVDELAHTNIPGSKHRKRYEDVQEILAAKIDVLSTLNIQHMESLAPDRAHHHRDHRPRDGARLGPA